MSPSWADRSLVATLWGMAGLAGGVVVLIAIFLVVESFPALGHVGLGRFVTDPSWHPHPRAAEGRFLLLPMLWGTLFASAGAVLLAAPLGILSAVFVHYYAPRFLGGVVRRVFELLAGIPSVIYGFWGLVVLVPLIRRLEPPGPSLLAGILVLATMIFPLMALMADAALASVPAEYLRGAAALGLSRWRTIGGVLLPAARSGLFTGAILQTARALGETMAVLMVCGNVVQNPSSLFAPIRTLTVNIALEMAYALGDHRAALFVSGLLLLVLVGVLLLAAELLGGSLHGTA